MQFVCAITDFFSVNPMVYSIVYILSQHQQQLFGAALSVYLSVYSYLAEL